MKNINIKPVNHGKTKADKNRYCGPSAISIITGMTTGEAARLLRHVSGRKTITGTWTSEVTNVLEMCNIKSTWIDFGLKLSRSKGPTLARFLKHTVKERKACVLNLCRPSLAGYPRPTYCLRYSQGTDISA